MNNQNLIIYEFDELYKILLEIKKNINLNLKKANKVNILELNLQSNCLIFTKKKIPEIDNQIIYDKFPISIQKLLEKINTELFLTNGKDKVKVPDNYCLLTEYIMKEEYFTFKSIRVKFPKVPEKIISECVNSLKNMKIVN